MSKPQRPQGDRRRRRRPPARTGRTSPTRDATLARLVEARRAVALPPITYPEALPVSARRDEIAKAIADHQVVVIAGETGSGKTTQIPKILLELGRGRDGQIAHTQPRRIAARSVAERISEELTGGRDALGSIVGFQVRFTDTSSEQTLVKLMTDGILLAQIQRDPLLRGYDTIVIDEAHERSLNIDFLLGYLTRLLPRRPDLKLVITSATIDSERFARHFASAPSADHPKGVPAPVVQVSGRTYPVELRYRPLVPDPEPDEEHPDDARPAPARRVQARGDESRDLMTGICEAVDELTAVGPGDILVFLSGEREIRDATDALRGHLGTDRTSDPRHPRYVEVLPLYSRLSAAEQHRVFESHPGRRVVLATNVAETSLTVPGVRYVVDPGTARISRWSKATKVQRLPIEPISQASAAQRSGRCGRVADGVAIRLYSEEDLVSRPEFTEPEILRTSLASVILAMINVGVAATPEDVAAFPFVEPPDTRAVRDGVALLLELGALEQTGTGPEARTRLTKVGKSLAMLPVDPRLARMIVEAGRRGVAHEVMIIAAALSIQDPRERPAEVREQADTLHRRFADPTSDLLSYLNLWHYVRERRHELSGSAFRRLCRAEHLNFLRLREWQDVVTQLRELSRESVPGAGSGRGSTVEPPEGDNWVREWDSEAIHRSVLAGLLSQIGQQEVTEVGGRGPNRAKGDRRGRPRPRNEYQGARGARFAIFPGSALAKKPPAWVMAAELVETSRLWARDVARIEPEWAEELADHLVKRSYSEPVWSTKRGAATATERVTLYGVPIVTDRRVLYAKVDPEHARELFIRHALVDGEWTTHHTFFHTNRALLAEAEQVEHRARRRGLVLDDDALFDFYDERVPADVVSARHFDQWWKQTRRRRPDLLTLDPAALLVDNAEEARDLTRYPDRWPQGDLDLPITYTYDPGTEHDGVTVHIPVQVLDRVVPDGFDRLVPGMQAELAVATIRALPKPVRVQLVPAPDVAASVVQWLGDQPSWADTVRAGDAAPSWFETFARAVNDLRGVQVPPGSWDEARLPAHLRVTFRVTDEHDGQVTTLDEGTDLIALQRRLSARSETAVRTAIGTAMREAAQRAGTTTPRQPRPSAVPHRPGATPTSTAPAHPLERAALSSWPTLDTPTDAIPERVEAEVAGIRVEGFPTLVAEEPATGPGPVDLRVLSRADPARHRIGVRELLLGELMLAAPRVTSRWDTTTSLALGASPYPSTAALVVDLQRAALDALLTEPPLAAGHAADTRDREGYETARTVLRDTLEDRVRTVASQTAGVLVAARELDADLRTTTSLALLSVTHDLRDWAEDLIADGFVRQVGAARLTNLVRYLRAAQHRLAKAAQNTSRDESLAWQVSELVGEYRAALQASRAAGPDPVRDAALVEVRWMLEELRVSLFAQHLGTPQPVSAKRIRAALKAVAPA